VMNQTFFWLRLLLLLVVMLRLTPYG
jgi:hypothetical protein